MKEGKNNRKDNRATVLSSRKRRTSTAATRPNKKEGKGQIAMYIVISILAGTFVLGVLYGAFWLLRTKPNQDFLASTLTITCTRDMGSKSKSPVCTDDAGQEYKISELFSQTAKESYYKGNGFNLVALKTFQGNEISRNEVSVKTYTGFQQIDGKTISNPIRESSVKDAEQAYANLWKEFLLNEPVQLFLPLMVDDTGGVTDKPNMSGFLPREQGLRIANEAIKNAKDSGNSLTLIVYRVGSNNYLDKKIVELPEAFNQLPKDAQKPLNEQVDQALNWLYEVREPKDSSSLIAGIFAAMNDDIHAGKPYRHFILFTDGLENTHDPEGTIEVEKKGIDLYNETTLLETANWATLDQRVVKISPFPKLAGASIDIYAPPAEGKNASLTEKALQYWKSRLSINGAKPVRVTFGY